MHSFPPTRCRDKAVVVGYRRVVGDSIPAQSVERVSRVCPEAPCRAELSLLMSATHVKHLGFRSAIASAARSQAETSPSRPSPEVNLTSSDFRIASNEHRLRKWQRKVRSFKSRTIAVRLISMAMTGYYKTFSRPRQHRPLSMLKYDPVETRRLQIDSALHAHHGVTPSVSRILTSHARRSSTCDTTDMPKRREDSHAPRRFGDTMDCYGWSGKSGSSMTNHWKQEERQAANRLGWNSNSTRIMGLGSPPTVLRTFFRTSSTFSGFLHVSGIGVLLRANDSCATVRCENRPSPKFCVSSLVESRDRRDEDRQAASIRCDTLHASSTLAHSPSDRSFAFAHLFRQHSLVSCSSRNCLLGSFATSDGTRSLSFGSKSSDAEPGLPLSPCRTSFKALFGFGYSLRNMSLSDFAWLHARLSRSTPRDPAPFSLRLRSCC
ncbi:hypothetical protein KC340_g10 [Hortaea werneckii]|nr:hypothetical protein KC340_g10 [Hortaea werneckii]